MSSDSLKFKFRTVLPIVRAAGLGYVTVVFAVIFLCSSAVIAFAEPCLTFGDAVWLCFQAITTIGFGDVVISTFASRAAIVILSLFSIFYLAVITGVVVAYCTEMVKPRTNTGGHEHDSQSNSQ